MDHHRCIHPALRGLEPPQLLPRPHVHAHHVAVACARVKHPACPNVRKHRRGERTVLRRYPRRARPHRLAGLLFKRIKPIPRRPLLAPVTRHPTHDHQIAVDHRRPSAPVRERQSPESLHQRVLPYHLAVRRKALHPAVRCHQVDIPRLRVHCRRAHCVPAVHRVAQVIVVSMLPQHLPILFIKALQHLLQIRSIAAVPPAIYPPIGHHSMPAPRNVARPQKIFLRAFHLKIGGQPRFIRSPILMRPPPIQPARSLRAFRIRNLRRCANRSRRFGRRSRIRGFATIKNQQGRHQRRCHREVHSFHRDMPTRGPTTGLRA